MMTSPGEWLQQSLLELSSKPHSTVHLDSDVIASFVSYCESAPPQLARDYLIDLIGEENNKDIITEYVDRRNIVASSETERDHKDDLCVYMKPRVDESLNFGSKKASKNSKSKITALEDNLLAVDSSSGSLSRGKNSGNRVKKGTKGISLADAAEGKGLISQGVPCTCQATRHKLINNCLSCGRIVCEQEGEGPCKFCGALVLREGSTYAGLEGVSLPVSEVEAAARALKDRLVESGRLASQRTTVIDDQGDYFQVEQNSWLSDTEKQSILKQQEEDQLKKEEQKKKMVVTIDITDRKVMMVDDGADVLDIKTGIKIDDISLSKSARRPNDIRIKPNPSVLENPVFLNLKNSSPGNRNISFPRGNKGNHHPQEWAYTGRVQHDDPDVTADVTHIQHADDNCNEISQSSDLRNGGCALLEDEECLLELKALNSSVIAFDICEPQIRNGYSLSPSTLAIKQAERKLTQENHSKIGLLMMPGMVLLKHWLSENDQVRYMQFIEHSVGDESVKKVKIVKICRDLSMGDGGFYQPSYGTESKMHLWMMCVGMHWEPTTNSYEHKRAVNKSVPPPIPSLFQELVAQCIQDAKHVLQNDTSHGSTLPDMHPNICLINFYERSGRLGLHQDKDESKESLAKGLPVVSFSIGDSADFVYSFNRNMDNAEHLTLESGDVLIFGGPSRMIYHGVCSILSQTAPQSLIERTNMRPGRLNLTFRQT